MFTLNIFCIVFPMTAQTDDCNARDSFDRLYAYAKAGLPEQKCVQIDVTASYDSAGADLELHWDLGDGGKANGLKVRHCYDQFGFYQPVLSVLNEAGDTISEKEITLDVIIKESVSLSLQSPDTMAVDSSFTAFAAVSELITYTQESAFIDFGDGNYSCGLNAHHQYELPGRYTIRVLMVLSNLDGEFYIKAEKAVLVRGYNVIGFDLYGYFERYADSLKPDYLDAPVRFCLWDETNHIPILSEEAEPSSFYGLLPPLNSQSRLFIWKGNQLAPPIPVPALNDSSEAFVYVLQAIKKNLESSPLSLKPVYFELNATKLDQKNRKILKENVKALQFLPGVVVKIGSYTHTGGMRGISEDYANERSGYIKNEIRKSSPKNVEMHIDPVQDAPGLINSCFDNPDCGIENKALNGRSDIKIVSIGGY